jgi:hypothetical protein
VRQPGPYTEKKHKVPSMDGTMETEETEHTQKKHKVPSMDDTMETEKTEHTQKKPEVSSMDDTMETKKDTKDKNKGPVMDNTKEAEKTEKKNDTMKAENATRPVSHSASSSRLTGEQRRQQNEFVPDPRNPAEVRLRALMDKKNIREARRKEKRANERKSQ